MKYMIENIKADTVSAIGRELNEKMDTWKKMELMKRCVHWIAEEYGENEAMDAVLASIVYEHNFYGFLSRFFRTMYYAACDHETREFSIGWASIEIEEEEEA